VPPSGPYRDVDLNRSTIQEAKNFASIYKISICKNRVFRCIVYKELTHFKNKEIEVEARTKALLASIRCEIIPENLGKLYHYHSPEVFSAGLKRLIESNHYICRAIHIAGNDKNLSLVSSEHLFSLLTLEIKIVGCAVACHIRSLAKRRYLHQISSGDYYELFREITLKNGIFDNLCKDSARRILDCQNSLLVAEGQKIIIVYEY
jgi:hypothetical protein